jgi:hypothetical protein
LPTQLTTQLPRKYPHKQIHVGIVNYRELQAN